MNWRVFLSFFNSRERGRKVVKDERKIGSMDFRTTPEEYFVKFLRFLSVE